MHQILHSSSCSIFHVQVENYFWHEVNTCLQCWKSFHILINVIYYLYIHEKLFQCVNMQCRRNYHQQKLEWFSIMKQFVKYYFLHNTLQIVLLRYSWDSQLYGSTLIRNNAKEINYSCVFQLLQLVWFKIKEFICNPNSPFYMSLPWLRPHKNILK